MQRPRLRKSRVRVFLDSGAFSAWTLGAKIDLDAYIAFIKENLEYIEHYVALDVIPGRKGRKETAADIEASARQSFSNWEYMRRQGLDPIPVYHQGEDPSWLRRYLENGAKYVGLSPKTQRESVSSYRGWLDDAWSQITDDKGWPFVDTHGFGVTSFELLFRYPWTSVDSTTWGIVAGMGGIMVPVYARECPLFDCAPRTVFLTDDSPKAHHYARIGDRQRAQVLSWVRECGFSIDEVKQDFRARYAVNICCYQKIADSKLQHPFRHRGNNALRSQ